MIIVCRSRFPLDQVLFYLRIGLLVSTVFMIVVFSLSLGTKELELHFSRGQGRSMPMEKMLTGPLALKENRSSPLALALEQKLVFLSQSVRPDLKQEDKVFHIGLKGGEAQSIVVKEGQPIFCHLKQHPSGGIDAFEFSESGETKIIPHVLDDKSLLLAILQGDGTEMEVILKAAGSQLVMRESGSLAISLQSAKWWGHDLFFKDYGAENYQALGQKQKIEIVQGKDRYVLFIKENDFLSFQKGKWVVIPSLNDADKESPLAKIVAVSPHHLEIEAWDEKGFPLFFSSIPHENAPPARFIAEQVLLDAKLRTARQVSCKIGKKRFLLQQGDWLIKTGSNWHKLLSLKDIDNFLSHDIRGELCVIDQIDSKGMIKGRYYNEMRTDAQSFTIRAASSKGSKKGKRSQ